MCGFKVQNCSALGHSFGIIQAKVTSIAMMISAMMISGMMISGMMFLCHA